MAPTANIWSQMGYTPPRGMCNHKEGLLSPKCPCQRFMIHPLKVSTSYECDGCSHHASFHDMENQRDDAIVKRWQAIEDGGQSQNGGNGSRKRPRRAIEGAASSSNGANLFGVMNDVSTGQCAGVGPTLNLRSGNKQKITPSAASLNSSTRIIDLSDTGEADSKKENYRTGSWVD